MSQSWAGFAGRRAFANGDWQAWTKPLGRDRHALLLFSNASAPLSVSFPLANISADLNASDVTVCARDLYKGVELGPVVQRVEARLEPHDSVLVTLRRQASAQLCSHA